MTSERPGGPEVLYSGDAGETVEVIDVVGGAGGVGGEQPDLVDALLSLHRAAFPDYSFALDEVAIDTRLDPDRDGIRVHQSLFVVDGVPAGFILFDTNAVRRFCVVHFAAVDRAARGVRVGGRRLSALAVSHALATSIHDLRGEVHGLRGLIGEAPAPAVRLWESIGLRRLPVEYAEPKHGRAWFEHLEATGTDPAAPVTDAPTAPIALMWLPAEPSDEPLPGPDVIRDAVAAYLLDHYWLDPEHPLVTELLGADFVGSGARPTGRQPNRRRRLSRYDN